MTKTVPSGFEELDGSGGLLSYGFRAATGPRVSELGSACERRLGARPGACGCGRGRMTREVCNVVENDVRTSLQRRASTAFAEALRYRTAIRLQGLLRTKSIAVFPGSDISSLLERLVVRKGIGAPQHRRRSCRLAREPQREIRSVRSQQTAGKPSRRRRAIPRRGRMPEPRASVANATARRRPTLREESRDDESRRNDWAPAVESMNNAVSYPASVPQGNQSNIAG